MKVFYAAGTYVMQAKLITDNNVDALRQAGYLAGFTTDNSLKDYVDCDIYHCHSTYSLNAMRKLKSLPNPPLIVLQRDSAHIITQMALLEKELRLHHRDPNEIRNQSRVEDQLEEYQLADAVLVASQFELHSFLENGCPWDKLSVVSFTCNSQVYTRPENKLQLISGDPFQVVFCGFDQFRKGIYYVERAIEKVQRENQVQIRLVSSINHAQINQIYGRSSLFILPTIEDGYPMAALEAMSCGLVPIVSKYTGTEQLILDGHNGHILEDPRDIEGIAQLILYYYNNRSRVVEVGGNARETIKQYQWPNYQRHMIEFYDRLWSSK